MSQPARSEEEPSAPEPAVVITGLPPDEWVPYWRRLVDELAATRPIATDAEAEQ